MRLNTGLTRGAVVLVGLFLFGCGATQQLNSQWQNADSEVTIDGKTTEWAGAQTVIETSGLVVGVRNDAENLYLSISTSQPQLQRQMLALGFTVWFDADGGKDKAQGIRYPMGLRDADPAEMRNLMGAGRRGRRPDRDLEESRQRREQMFHESLQEMEIIGPDAESIRRLYVAEAKGLTVKIDRDAGTFVYELKIPLKEAGGSFSLDASEGQAFALGFETTRFDQGEFRGRRGQGGRGAGGLGGGGLGGGVGGGRGGGSRGRSPGQRPTIPEPLDLWVTVQLEAPGSSN